MSSGSRKRSRVPDVWIVGSEWAAGIVARAFGERGTLPGLLTVPSSAALPVAIHVGNGECRESARRVFGEAIAGMVWELSEASFVRARATGLTEGYAAWLAATPKEEELLRLSGGDWRTAEPWLTQGEATFRGARTEPALLVRRLPESSAVRAARLLAIESAGSLQYRIRYADEAGKERAVESSVVIVVSDELPPAHLPWLHDKLLPVTLTSVLHPARVALPFMKAIFHLGADFAISSREGLRLGSYRNLYEDKAYGIHATPDPATLDGIDRFFRPLGWIGGEPRIALEVATLSCDGLPIVGALPDMPGVHVVAGFAARTQNFIFEVAHRLAAGILGGKGASELDRFSTKRFA